MSPKQSLGPRLQDWRLDDKKFHELCQEARAMEWGTCAHVNPVKAHERLGSCLTFVANCIELTAQSM